MKPDPIELEVFKHLFAAVAEEMGTRLMRSAYSPNIKERRDFSCALFNAEGELLAQAAHIPVHLGAMPASVAAVLRAFSPVSLAPSDVLVVNDPFCGGTHLPDITVVAPVMLAGEATPRFYVANRAHHADVGGISPGSMPLSSSIDEEGVRFPPCRLDAERVELICEATRTPAERRGDLRAQVAALEVGAARISALCERYGVEHVATQGRELLDYTERIVRSVISAIPDGEYASEDWLDGDGFSREAIRIAVSLRVEGEQAQLDFRAAADQVTGPVNAVRAVTKSAVNYAFRCLLPPGTPSNGGVMRPVQVITRPGSIVDAEDPAAVAAGNVETSQRIVDVVLAALAQALPELIPAASCGSMNNVTIGGTDPRTGQAYAYYETIAGGAGAGPAASGAAAVHTHMTNTLNTPLEALEHAYPLLVEEYSIRRGSGGLGAQRGGDGIIRRYKFKGAAEITLLGERRSTGAPGRQGGSPGQPGLDEVIKPDGTRIPLASKSRCRLEQGDRLQISTPGGGGWGGADQADPLDVQE